MNIQVQPLSVTKTHSPLLRGSDCRADDAYLMSCKEWSIIDCARTFYRRKHILLYVIGGCMLAAGFISVAQPGWYRSEAALEIHGINENFLNTRDIYPAASSGADSSGVYLQTQVEMLQQDSLFEEVAKKLTLEDRLELQSRSALVNMFTRRSLIAQDVGGVASILKRQTKIAPSKGSRIVRIICDARDPRAAADIANTLAQTYIDQTIEVRRLTAEQIEKALRLQLATLNAKLRISQSQIAAFEHSPGLVFALRRQSAYRASSAHPLEMDYSALKLENETDRRLYETLSQRLNETRLAVAVPATNIELLGVARPAQHPYKPNLLLNLSIAMFGGLVCAIGWVMLSEQTNSFLRAPGEAGSYLALPELGAIPQMNSRKRHRVQPSDETSLNIERAVTEPLHSALSESFRGTLASILSASHIQRQGSILLVTSPLPMEGKTTVVSNLAIGLAGMGRRVLLIDADMRRPRLHKIFGQANSWGLSDLLREKNAIEDLPSTAILKRTAVPNVYLLPSGVGTENIFGLLWSPRIARLFPRFRQEFDHVLIDVPPCLEFADARIMARYIDSLLLVVRANHTDRTTAQIAVQRLIADGIPVMGVILNGYDPEVLDLYGYRLSYDFARRSV